MKGVGAAGAIAGVVCLVVAAEFAVPVLIISSIVGGGTTAGDAIAVKVKKGRIHYRLAEMFAVAREMAEIKEQLERYANLVAE